MPRTKEISLMPSRRHPRARSLVALACLAGAVPLAASSTAATATTYTAKAAASCSGQSTGKKGAYLNKLTVSGLSCKSGKKVMLDHDKCRVAHGVKGKCTKVDGYKCTEGKRSDSGDQFDVKVTCKKGSKKVSFYVSQSY
jgi:hypothetical protein